MFQLRPSTGLAARRPAERQSNPPASQTSTASSVRSSACLRSNTSRKSRTRRPRARAPRPVRSEGRRCSESWSTTTWTWTRSWTCLTSSPPPAAKESLLSPVSWPDLRKPKPADQDSLRAPSAHASEPDTPLSDGGPSAFPLPPRQDKPWRTFGEADEENKKTQNILNIVREGQISLLVRASNTSLTLR